MTLTPEQKKRLAKEARKLAMECLTNGPEMSDHWCSCAIGLSLKRAGLWRGEEYDMSSHHVAKLLELEFSQMPTDQWPSKGILSTAARERRDGNRTAVVIPLLAWADELDEEASAASARNAPPETSRAGSTEGKEK